MGQRKKPKEPEEEFILYLKEHGASEHTVDSCLAALRLFFRLYGEISAENLDAFRRYLMEHYKISTVNSRIYGINRFLAYCSECKNSYETSGKWALPEKNFRLGVIRSQNPPFLDNIISEKDYEKLRDNLKKDRDMKWYFAVRFLACTGARKGAQDLFPRLSLFRSFRVDGLAEHGIRFSVPQPKRRSRFSPLDQQPA